MEPFKRSLPQAGLKPRTASPRSEGIMMIFKSLQQNICCDPSLKMSDPNISNDVQNIIMLNAMSKKKKNQRAEGAGGLGIISSNKVGESE